MTKQIPAEQAERLKALLMPIADMFRSSKITIVVRAPEGANSVGTLVFSSDNPTKAMEALRHHMEEEAKRFAAEGERSGTEGAEFPVLRNLDQLD